MKYEAEFSIIQNGLKVASGSGPLDQIIKEALRYLYLYSEEAPCKLTIKVK